jgi:hypothetical protein
MERSPICPVCLSKYEDIHGALFGPGATHPCLCADSWHKGALYNPNLWLLTESDILFLHEMCIGAG